MSKTEISKLNDPNFVLELAAGPPMPNLVPQKKEDGLLHMGKKYSDKPKRFVFKKAHMSKDDFRIFDFPGGKLVCNAWHEGKNPYGALDPLGLGNSGPKLEWDSLMKAQGYHGMPGFKIKPKLLSAHGTQNIMTFNNEILFGVANTSRLKTGSLRHNLEIRQGNDGPVVYKILVDLAGRTMQVVNQKEEQVAFVQKTMKAMIQNAAMGGGSEMVIDVAPGVDWTVIIAAVIGIQQVGANFLKDVVSNFVVPSVQDAALDAVGLGGVADVAGKQTDQIIHNVKMGQNLLNQFYKM